MSGGSDLYNRGEEGSQDKWTKSQYRKFVLKLGLLSGVAGRGGSGACSGVGPGVITGNSFLIRAGICKVR